MTDDAMAHLDSSTDPGPQDGWAVSGLSMVGASVIRELVETRLQAIYEEAASILEMAARPGVPVELARRATLAYGVLRQALAGTIAALTHDDPRALALWLDAMASATTAYETTMRDLRAADELALAEPSGHA